MRDKYNLNTLPKGQEDAADYGMYSYYIILSSVSCSGITKAIHFAFFLILGFSLKKNNPIKIVIDFAFN